MANLVDITPSALESAVAQLQNDVESFLTKCSNLSEIVSSVSGRWISGGANQAASQNVSNALQTIRGMSGGLKAELSYMRSYAAKASAMDESAASAIKGI